jgi:hypothetical protein
MRRLSKLILFLILCSGASLKVSCQPIKQGPDVPSAFCISSLEMKLYNMINEYRARYDLPPVPLSKSLCYVASAHVKDLFFHHPDIAPCNFHSWSDKGPWKPFCYPRDENKKNSVWDKPKELTKYKGKGYEIVYWENNPVNIDSIIPFWRSIGYFNNFLMNTGKWEGKKWNAIGIAIYENYAAAWFGEVPDTTGKPDICGHVKENKPVVTQEVPMADTTALKTPPAGKKGKKTVKPSPPVQPVPPMGQKQQPAADSAKHSAVEIVKTRTEKLYIIVKSMRPLNELKKTAENLKSQGYAEAKILEKDQKYRVSIMEFDSKEKADSALREVKKSYKDAWLLKF